MVEVDGEVIGPPRAEGGQGAGLIAWRAVGSERALMGSPRHAGGAGRGWWGRAARREARTARGLMASLPRGHHSTLLGHFGIGRGYSGKFTFYSGQ